MALVTAPLVPSPLDPTYDDYQARARRPGHHIVPEGWPADKMTRGCAYCGNRHARNLCCGDRKEVKEVHEGELEFMGWAHEATAAGSPEEALAAVGYDYSKLIDNARNDRLFRWTCCGVEPGAGCWGCDQHNVRGPCLCASCRAGEKPEYIASTTNRLLRFGGVYEGVTEQDILRGITWRPDRATHNLFPTALRARVVALLRGFTAMRGEVRPDAADVQRIVNEYIDGWCATEATCIRATADVAMPVAALPAAGADGDAPAGESEAATTGEAPAPTAVYASSGEVAALREKGKALFLAGRHEDSFEAYGKALAKLKAEVEALTAREEAKRDEEAAMVGRPQRVWAAERRVYSQQDHKVEVEGDAAPEGDVIAATLKTLRDEQAVLLLNSAQCMWKMEDYNESICYTVSSLLINPKSAKAHYRLAENYVVLKHWRLALFHYEQSLQRDRGVFEKAGGPGRADHARAQWRSLQDLLQKTQMQNFFNMFDVDRDGRLGQKEINRHRAVFFKAKEKIGMYHPTWDEVKSLYQRGEEGLTIDDLKKLYLHMFRAERAARRARKREKAKERAAAMEKAREDAAGTGGVAGGRDSDEESEEEVEEKMLDIFALELGFDYPQEVVDEVEEVAVLRAVGETVNNEHFLRQLELVDTFYTRSAELSRTLTDDETRAIEADQMKAEGILGTIYVRTRSGLFMSLDIASFGGEEAQWLENPMKDQDVSVCLAEDEPGNIIIAIKHYLRGMLMETALCAICDPLAWTFSVNEYARLVRGVLDFFDVRHVDRCQLASEFRVRAQRWTRGVLDEHRMAAALTDIFGRLVVGTRRASETLNQGKPIDPRTGSPEGGIKTAFAWSD